jgi:hypothetical protein
MAFNMKVVSPLWILWRGQMEKKNQLWKTFANIALGINPEQSTIKDTLSHHECVDCGVVAAEGAGDFWAATSPAKGRAVRAQCCDR